MFWLNIAAFPVLTPWDFATRQCCRLTQDTDPSPIFSASLSTELPSTFCAVNGYILKPLVQLKNREICWPVLGIGIRWIIL